MYYEQWAQNYLERLENLLNTINKEEVKIDSLKGMARVRDRLKITKTYVVKRFNLESIVNYSKYLKIKPYSITTIGLHSNLLICFAHFVEKSFKEVSKEDIEKFLHYFSDKSAGYQSRLKMTVKLFFKWFYGCVGKDDYPELVDWIVWKNNGLVNKLPNILTIEEITKMLVACDGLRDRALISVLYESGCRASEILDLKINEVNFDEYGAFIIANGKTGSRRIRLISSIPDLKAWLNIHPRKSDLDAPLFCTLTKNNKGNPLGGSSLGFVVRQIAKKVGVKKKIYPHLFRHTRATHLAKYLTEQELKIYFGWTKNSNMPSIYVHLSGRDVENKILELNGVKLKDDTEKLTIPAIKCYRCGESNSVGDKFCWKCLAPLEQKTIEKLEDFKKIISELTLHIFEKMKEKKIGEGDLENVIREWYKIKDTK